MGDKKTFGHRSQMLLLAQLRLSNRQQEHPLATPKLR